jgi:hypothetical protein
MGAHVYIYISTDMAYNSVGTFTFCHHFCFEGVTTMRTYLPTVFRLLQFLCAFIAKHRVRILQTIGDDKAPQLDALMLACDVFTQIILPFVTPTE